MDETWKQIPSRPIGYEASSLGRIRNVGRKSSKPFLKSRIATNGYLVVGLSSPVPVHQLIAEAFIGVRPDGMVVNHKNGLKTDNRPENLEYVTVAENNRHAFRTGLRSNPSGDAAFAAKYRFEQLSEMRSMRSNGAKLNEICRRFGASKSYVSEVVRGLHRASA